MKRIVVAASMALTVSMLGACRHKVLADGACGPVPASVIAAAGMPVFSGCETDTKVGEFQTPEVPYWTPAQRLRTGCFYVTVEFVVDPDGITIGETVRVRAASDHNFQVAVLRTLYGAQYVPATKAGRNVAQLVRITRKAELVYWERVSNGLTYSYYPMFSNFPRC